MLVLTRKTGEAIVLPSKNVTIKVVAVRGHRVTLAISAPREVRVLRSELMPDDSTASSVCAAKCADSARP